MEFALKRIKAELLPKYPNVDDVVALTHAYGCGVAINAPGAVVPIRTLQNLAHNPNFGGEVHGGGPGLREAAARTLLPESMADGDDPDICACRTKPQAASAPVIDGIMEMVETSG